MTPLMLLADELTRERLREAERYRLAASVKSQGRLHKWMLQRIGLSRDSDRLKGRTPLFLISAAVALAITIGGCVSFGVDSYEEFRSAVDSGASCEQLIDMQDNFAGTPDEARVAEDLKDIGCDTPGSTRSDQ